jgi:hypothetical protein
MIRGLLAQSKRPLDNLFVEALVAGPLYLGGWVFVVGHSTGRETADPADGYAG